MRITAADIMTTTVVTAQTDGSVARVAQLLDDHGSSALPVRDVQGVVVGMLGEGDLIRHSGRL
jgi:CBS-domain-containing membrane protein